MAKNTHQFAQRSKSESAVSESDRTEAQSLSKGGYTSFTSTDGRTIIVCGRKRQMFALLAEARKRGQGVRKGGAHSRLWNMAEAARQLAADGVLIGRRLMHFTDENTSTGKGGVCDYYLLEDWTQSTRLYDRERGAKMAAAKLSPSAFKAKSRGSFLPFTKSGAIAHEREIELLNPAQKTTKGKRIMRRRARDDAKLVAEAGRNLSPSAIRRTRRNQALGKASRNRRTGKHPIDRQSATQRNKAKAG